LPRRTSRVRASSPAPASLGAQTAVALAKADPLTRSYAAGRECQNRLSGTRASALKDKTMYRWRKAADPCWLSAREEILEARARGALVVISRPGRKRLELEIPCDSQRASQRFIHEFGGRVEKLSREWLKRFAGKEKPKPLRIAKRLVVVHSLTKRKADSFPYSLIVPPGAAFGTGEHATTAMSLRLLEEATRRREPRSVVDLGTGSGILALAAICFGAERVVAVDIDPMAIATAKTNARLNKIENVDCQLGDVRRWNPRRKIDIVTANLFSGLLIQILPKLKRSTCLILSGVLRTQEKEFVRALRRHKINPVEVRRRGKWIAVLAKTI
jgi:ribosomal protein L11 methyltransferase